MSLCTGACQREGLKGWRRHLYLWAMPGKARGFPHFALGGLRLVCGSQSVRSNLHFLQTTVGKVEAPGHSGALASLSLCWSEAGFQGKEEEPWWSLPDTSNSSASLCAMRGPPVASPSEVSRNSVWGVNHTVAEVSSSPLELTVALLSWTHNCLGPLQVRCHSVTNGGGERKCALGRDTTTSQKLKAAGVQPTENCHCEG